MHCLLIVGAYGTLGGLDSSILNPRVCFLFCLYLEMVELIYTRFFVCGISRDAVSLVP